MRAIWKGSISFGLVNIPVALYPAIGRDEVSFRLLRRSDLSPVNYKRVAEADGREVPWDEIVKGFEYEKGKFVTLKDEDFDRVEVEAAQTVHILSFVSLKDVNPMFFYKPYYIEPQKGGERAYALLCETLKNTARVGIAKVVIRTKEHLAAVKEQGGILILELMHFENELQKPNGLNIPHSNLAKKELDMAQALVESMTEKWDPSKYHDDYREGLMKVIEQKIQSGGKELPKSAKEKPKPAPADNLVAILQQSLRETESKLKPAASGKMKPRRGIRPAKARSR